MALKSFQKNLNINVLKKIESMIIFIFYKKYSTKKDRFQH